LQRANLRPKRTEMSPNPTPTALCATAGGCLGDRSSQRFMDCAVSADHLVAEQTAWADVILIPVMMVDNRIEADAFNRNARPLCRRYFSRDSGKPLGPLLTLRAGLAHQDRPAIAGVDLGE